MCIRDRLSTLRGPRRPRGAHTRRRRCGRTAEAAPWSALGPRRAHTRGSAALKPECAARVWGVPSCRPGSACLDCEPR
eukprot:2486355-Prymnesium_polylepis.1